VGSHGRVRRPAMDGLRRPRGGIWPCSRFAGRLAMVMLPMPPDNQRGQSGVDLRPGTAVGHALVGCRSAASHHWRSRRTGRRVGQDVAGRSPALAPPVIRSGFQPVEGNGGKPSQDWPISAPGPDRTSSKCSVNCFSGRKEVGPGTWRTARAKFRRDQEQRQGRPKFRPRPRA